MKYSQDRKRQLEQQEVREVRTKEQGLFTFFFFMGLLTVAFIIAAVGCWIWQQLTGG